jgi:hypothetical protein
MTPGYPLHDLFMYLPSQLSQHSLCQITALSASFTHLTWMKGHVDLVIYKIAYLTNDSPYCYPLVISTFFFTLYALPHLVTTLSARNVTIHLLHFGPDAPNTLPSSAVLLAPLTKCSVFSLLVFSALGLSGSLVAVLFSPSSGPNCVEAGWTRRSKNMPEPCCTPQRLHLTQECDSIWFSII